MDFPDNYTGAGPMFAAVPLGTPWLETASAGNTTYVLESPYGMPAELTNEEANAAYNEYTGSTAFLDRAQVEQIADARGDGTFVRYDGLCGSNDWTAKAQREYAAEAA